MSNFKIGRNILDALPTFEVDGAAVVMVVIGGKSYVLKNRYGAEGEMSTRAAINLLLKVESAHPIAGFLGEKENADEPAKDGGE